MTIGGSLKTIEDQKTSERIALRSNQLRKFVKEDLLKALRTAIADGHDDYAPVLAPKEIRPLFASSIDGGTSPSHKSKNNVYYDVWRELDEWADSEDLFIRTGHNLGKDNYVRPWSDYDWGGSLGILKKKPEPVRPIPPETRKAKAEPLITIVEMLWGIGISVLSTFLITYFSFGNH